MERKKILFISYSLQQAGAEKYAYELIKNIDQSKFDVEILTTNDAKTNNTFPHVYFFLLRNKGFKIKTFFNDKQVINPLKKYIFGFTKLINIGIRKINSYGLKLYDKKMCRLFSNHDAVILIDVLYYHMVKPYVSSAKYFETHLMCHEAQFEKGRNLYSVYEKRKSHNLVYIDSLQIQEANQQGVKINQSFNFPLSMDIPEKKYIQRRSHIKRIGVFTRISRIKPLDKIISAFMEFTLIDGNSDTELFLFGFIQDVEYFKTLMGMIEKLGLKDKIIFAGHSENMTNSATKHDIDLVWAVSIYDFIGYAAIELSLNGIPMILNNIDDSGMKPTNDQNATPPYFYDPVLLAHYTHEVSINKKTDFLQSSQYKKYSTNHNIKKNIKNYENHLLSVLS